MSKRIDVMVPQEQIEEQIKIIKQINTINKEKDLLAYTVTFGCQQNENDTERIRGMLSQMGYGFTNDKEKADLIIFNTCAVREGAEYRVYGNIGALKNIKAQRSDLIIGVCGCMMQQEHVVKYIKDSFPYVDMIFGTHTLHKLPQILQGAMKRKKRIISVEDSHGYIAEGLPILREGKTSAAVTIMNGCNNYCSYCIVPYTRGRERSRGHKDIINEVKNIAENGYSEIMLLGQNVNSYGKDINEGIDFAHLLRDINKISGIKRIRFMTSHPKDLSDRLIDAMAECENVCEHLHLPFQSGSDRILELMNRRYTREHYLKLIDRVREKIPGIALSTDVIVGFPGETNEDFEYTMQVLEQVEFDIIYSFIYSKRKGTPAEAMEDIMSREQKQQNFERMLTLQNAITKKCNDAYLGGVYELLVEGQSKTNPEVLTGRTRTNKIVNFKGDISLTGGYTKVKITNSQTWSLTGELLND